ncbi:MAG: mitochondrial fission ELM1 family protein [Pseudomonadota bacterium]
MGHRQQVEGVLRALATPARLIELDYRWPLGPSDLVPLATIRHLTPATRALLLPPWPDVVVAAGRRTAPVARWLERASGGRVFTVQLMRPGCLAGLDLVAIPAHDRPRPAANVVTTLGAPHPFDRAVLDAALAELPEAAARLPDPRIAVLVGGPSGSVPFDRADEARFVAELGEFARSLDASLLVTTSRRTPDSLLRALGAVAGGRMVLHRFGAPGPNPFRAFLAAADRVVVTADSASMLSEASATGRPIHVFRPQGLPDKHGRLVDALAAAGYVRPWSAEPQPVPPPLDEAGRLAAIVRTRAALAGQRPRV